MTNATLIDGKLFAKKIHSSITDEVRDLVATHGVTPGLAVVLVGDDPASHVYVKNKGRQTKAAGMQSFEHILPSTVSQDDLLGLIDKLNVDEQVNGILVQLPLPEHIEESTVLNAIIPSKDVDGFHPINVGNLHTEGKGIAPCTPYGCSLLLKDQLGDLSGKNAVIIGRSNIVGKPMAALLLAQHCTVTIAHSRTKDIASICRQADILVVAVGIPSFVKADWVKPGATVIDVGINRINIDDGKTRLVGDVDFDSVCQQAGAITPVPGGVGPMTIACLLYNTLLLTCQQNKLQMPTVAP